MFPSVTRSKPTQTIAGIVVLALAYIACAELGFSLAFTTKQVTAVWPPTGVAVAALLLFGRRVWPGIFLGALVSNALAQEPLWTAALIAAGNTAAPLTAAVVLRRIGFDNALERTRDVIALLVAGASCMAISATNGVATLALAGIVPAHAFASVWPVWWAGDAMGVLLVAPALLAYATPSTRTHRGRPLELALLFLALLTITSFSFLSAFPIRLSVYPLLMWSALRFAQRETSTAILIVAIITIWGTAHQLGAFGAGTLDQRLVSVMSFLAPLLATGLILGASTSERRAATERLTDAVETLQSAFLPRELPQRAGVFCDALYVAAENEALIGGDWYDAFSTPDGSIVVSIGDVAGHGLAAAVAASHIRETIFASAFEGADPAEVLEHVNRTIEAAQRHTIATALVGVIDVVRSILRYACAGHPPPLLATPASAATSLPFDGVTLGTGHPVAATTHAVALQPGSTLLFYTDGLVEFDRDAERAEARLYDVLTRIAADRVVQKPAEFIARAVTGRAAPRDDVALLLVRID